MKIVNNSTAEYTMCSIVGCMPRRSIHVVIDNGGYYNATKLCEQYDRSFEELENDVADIETIVLSLNRNRRKLVKPDESGNDKVIGVYLHPMTLFRVLFQLDKEFYYSVANDLRDYFEDNEVMDNNKMYYGHVPHSSLEWLNLNKVAACYDTQADDVLSRRRVAETVGYIWGIYNTSPVRRVGKRVFVDLMILPAIMDELDQLESARLAKTIMNILFKDSDDSLKAMKLELEETHRLLLNETDRRDFTPKHDVRKYVKA